MQGSFGKKSPKKIIKWFFFQKQHFSFLKMFLWTIAICHRMLMREKDFSSTYTIKNCPFFEISKSGQFVVEFFLKNVFFHLY